MTRVLRKAFICSLLLYFLSSVYTRFMNYEEYGFDAGALSTQNRNVT